MGVGEHLGGDAVDVEAEYELGHRLCALLILWRLVRWPRCRLSGVTPDAKAPQSSRVLPGAIRVRQVSTSTRRVR